MGRACERVLETGAGPKRQRIVVESAVSSVDSGGEPILTWTTLTNLWAEAEYLSSGEFIRAAKPNVKQMVRFRTDYDSRVDEEMRIQWRSLTWNIEGIEPFEALSAMILTVSRVD